MAGTATAYYEMLDTLKETLEGNPLINTVTYGSIYDAANDKTTMFPLAHFTVNNTKLTDSTFIFSMTLFIADLVDVSKEEATDKFRGNDNTMDIHNSTLASLSDAMLMFKRQGAVNSGYSLIGEPTMEAFTHRFNADTAGWYVDFDVEVIQRMEVGC